MDRSPFFFPLSLFFSIELRSRVRMEMQGGRGGGGSEREKGYWKWIEQGSIDRIDLSRQTIVRGGMNGKNYVPPPPSPSPPSLSAGVSRRYVFKPTIQAPSWRGGARDVSFNFRNNAFVSD